MGMIRIETYGSFGKGHAEFSAMEHGHAHAISQAIVHLTDLLRWSINQDHALHEAGEEPEKGFTALTKEDK